MNWADFELAHIGYVGVSMFFALSGFLITLLLVREWDVTSAVSLTSFYRRRAYRILPAYVVFLSAVFVLTRIHALTLTTADWRGALTYTMNYVKEPTWEMGHLWSLSVEEQFYLVWPLLFVALRRARQAANLLVCYLVGIPLLRVALWAMAPGALDTLDVLTPLRLDAIAAGCLLALLATRPEMPRVLVLAQKHASKAGVLALLVLMLSFPLGRSIWAYRVTFRYVVDAVALATLIWTTANNSRSWLGRFLEARPVVSLGILSYSLYLWQQLVLTPGHPASIGSLAGSIAMAIILAAGSYHLIERPFLRKKEARRPLSVAFDTTPPGLQR
jgi:peptidoglycan/LPS O-acetylase OafA/YrhL